MKLLLSSLLLASLCACSSWSVSSGTLVVTQTPNVSVVEGETVNIICCWTGEFERVTLNWLKNQTDFKRELLSSELLQKNASSCSNLTFTKITIEDSGRYTCRVSVEISLFTVVEGNGTVITVKDRDKVKDNTDTPESDSSHQEEVFIYVLRCLPILFLVTCFFCLNKLRTKARQHTPAAPGNPLPSAQRVEEDRDEEERDEKGTEAE